MTQDTKIKEVGHPDELSSVATYIGKIEVFGGPAFPTKFSLPMGGEYQSPGMTLRDWFAGQAREKDIMAHQEWVYGDDPLEGASPVYSREAAKYRYADAMLAERSKAEGRAS